MRHMSRMHFTVFTGTILALGILMTPVTGQANDLDSALLPNFTNVTRPQ